MLLHSDYLEGTTPATRRVLFLHGILGRGSNLRIVAQKFLQANPGWDALTVDLRGHGRSPKGLPAPSIASAAADVRELCSPTVAAIVGHSFGGKVALEMLRQNPPPTLRHMMTLDSNPGPRSPMPEPDSPTAVIAMLRTFPATFTSRNEFIQAVMARGLALPIAQWLAMSTDILPEGGGIRFALDLDEIEALLADYFTRDYWPLLENPPTNIHLVIADRSTSYSATDRERAKALISDRVSVDVLPAGHWVHTDDLEGVVRVLSSVVKN